MVRTISRKDSWISLRKGEKKMTQKYQLRVTGFPGSKDDVAVVFDVEDGQDVQEKAREAWVKRESTHISARTILEQGISTNITLERIGEVLDKCWDPR
jgi:hypothetical protein